MKLQITLLTTVLTLFSSPVLAAAVPDPAPEPEPAQASGTSHNPSTQYNWHFDLFKNKRCSDAAININGTGSSGCRKDVPKGGIVAFTKVDVDPHCKVTLYKDSKCSKGQDIGSIDSDAKTTCALASKKKAHIKSFQVKC
ncbi:hypothetical protein N7481_007772 [Penicillium waksmanii]|uniref:uncharacterized protein n=1 Tax=Penicillium waksmanii TaxID=69791 RepID=UPI0025466923|nr:uncharacterized protein N7481_007772 [Penicillium waksmanii]KAJ5980474.1 hypothetical protein N7481_007772 [Penicillium waksmanii]